MHKKYAKDGLVVITVSLDTIDDEDQKENEKVKVRVLNFLKEHSATSINLLLDESIPFYQEKLGFNVAPCIFVFDRQGKWTRFNPPAKHHEDVEQLVTKLLQEKS